jgi:hypothetical protein
MTIVDEARGNLSKACPYCKLVGEHACNCWDPNEAQGVWNTAYWRIIDGKVMFYGLSHEAAALITEQQRVIDGLKQALEEAYTREEHDVATIKRLEGGLALANQWRKEEAGDYRAAQARIKELEAKLEAVGRHLTGKDR